MRTVVLADIPGLIEGASQGIGLGHEFLRHIERTRILIHVIDGLSEDPIQDFNTINAELAAFGHGLADKPQIVAMNKMDLPDAQAAYDLFVKGEGAKDAPWRGLGVLPISAVTGENVRVLLHKAVTVLDELPPPPEPVLDLPEITLSDSSLEFKVTRELDGFRVHSQMLERRVQITRWDLDEAVQKFQRALERSGIGPELERMGVKIGDMVYIGDYELEWAE
jgi:GTP-binding protein